MYRTAFIVGLAAVFAPPIGTLKPAYADGRTVGNWFVEINKDPFSPKKKTVVANASEGHVLAIRCFPDDGLSAIVGATSDGASYDKDASVSFRYRADEGPITDDKGAAFGPKMAVLPNARQILTDALKASTLYLRVETPDGTLVDMAFKTRGASKALAQVVADCPAVADQTPDDKK